MKSFARGVALLAASTTVWGLAPGVAEAAPTARVVAQTQKMTGPSLKTKQVGWYPANVRVGLQCYERGQAVKGALSKWHPNGGWDDLWYKTTDGVFVADIDIDTGSNNPVTGRCGATAPAPAAQPPAAPASSGWQRPVSGPVTQTFGSNPAFNRQFGLNGHNGTDFGVRAGTPVVAASDGIVRSAGRGDSWMGSLAGVAVLIRHSSVYTGYAHLSRVTVSPGQRVKKGQLIGYSGSTGASTGPHLHFEALPLNPNFKNGFAGRINPAPYGG